jgi:site-specific recombinase XerC
MASLYRPTYTKAEPNAGIRLTRKVRKWYGKFRDAAGKVRCVPLCEDKTVAMAMLTDLIRSERLCQAGMLDPFAGHLSQLIDHHLRDYELYLNARARDPKHIAETLRTIRNVAKACSAELLADLQNASDRLERYLAERRQAGASHRTINADLVAVRAFCRWLVRRRRMHDDPTLGLQRLNEDEDPRVERRAITDEEIERLLVAVCRSSRVVGCLGGRDRAILYLVALRTGLRRGELRSLTLNSFDFTGVPAIVTLRASKSKRRRADTLPLPSSVVHAVREYLAGRSADEPVWPGSWWRISAKMLRLDLADAGIAAEDSEGLVVDFHALRTTFITGIARAGIAPAVVQKLARHSDVNLTLGTYTRLQMTDLAGAVDKLPTIDSITAGSLANDSAA